MNYYQLSISKIQQLLNTNQDGLTLSDAEERLKKYGKNELTEKKKTTVLVFFLHQFKDVMIFILLVAAVVSFAIGDLIDAIECYYWVCSRIPGR